MDFSKGDLLYETCLKDDSANAIVRVVRKKGNVLRLKTLFDTARKTYSLNNLRFGKTDDKPMTATLYRDTVKYKLFTQMGRFKLRTKDYKRIER